MKIRDYFMRNKSVAVNISETRLHEAPCKLITKHSKIGGRGTKSCPLCLTEKLPDGNHVNHIE